MATANSGHANTHEQEHGMAVSKDTGKSLNMGGHKVKSGNAKT